ncbi:potassium voltage-gated channel subfamily H member 7-like [Branchiostoma floridae]|uniref:Potassium voltage-gated channel subfamily H member 7-like n=1 Tax=Branchiostoma floridae TaxID=7739 RepID=A0A9J7L102_BRAFL|nr:potassium voltage-gated channel subfamily H member 7-like [Branchiostoma floridae]
MAMFQLNRLLRTYRIQTFFDMLEMELGLNTVYIRTLKYTAVSWLCLHVMACGWFALGCTGKHWGIHEDCGGWTASTGTNFLFPNNNTGYEYVMSVYWATATSTSTGYGDVHAQTLSEKAYSIVAMLAGVAVFFGMILGGMTSMLTNMDSQRAGFTHRLDTIKQYLIEEDIPENAQQQIMNYYNYFWIRKRGVQSEGIFDILPFTFRAEIAFQTNKGILEKTQFFSHHNVGFMRMLTLGLKPTLCLPNQVIAVRGDSASQMCFVHRGEIEVISEDDTPIASFRHGKIFGELSLIFNVPRTVTIRAATHCDLMVLEKKDLHTILNHYPEVMKRLHEMAQQRFNSPNSPLAGLVDVGSSQDGMFGHLTTGPTDDADGAEPESSPGSNRRASSVRRFDRRKQSVDPMTGHRDSIMVSSDAGRPYLGSSAGMDIEDSIGESTGSASLSSHLSTHSRSMSRAGHRKSIMISGSVELLNANLEPPVEEGASCAWCRLKWLDVVDWVSSHVLDPTSIFCRCWDIFINILIFAVCLIHSYFAAFYVTRKGANVGWAVGSSGFIASYLMDVPLLMDLVIRLRTGVFTPNGVLKDWGSIRTHYVRSWCFVLDLCSILPLELFALASHHRGTVRLGLVACLKLNRLIKCYKIPKFFTKVEESLHMNILLARSLKLFAYIILFTHWCSCLLYAQSCPGFNTDKEEWCVEGSWVDNQGLSLKEVSMHHYWISFYFATSTMTSTGYGDIVPSTTTGRVLSMVVMIVGLLLCGYCVSTLAATLANMDAARVEYQGRLTAARQFMKDHGICPNLRRRVVNYMVLMWRKLRGEAVAGSMGLMHDMPLALQQDVAFEEAKAVLEQVPLFQQTDPYFLRELAVRSRAVLYAPGDVIVYSGDITRDLHMIRKGYCEILTDDLAETISLMGPGQYFGQLPLLFGDQQPDTIRSKTYVEMIILTRDDLDDVLSKYPLVEKQFDDLTKIDDFHEELRRSKPGNKEGPSKARIRAYSQIAAMADGKQLDSLFLPNLNRKRSARVFKVYPEEAGENKEYLEPFRQESKAVRILSKVLMRRTFMTSGTWFRIWIALRQVMSAASTFTYTLQAAFMRESWPLFGFNIGLDVCNFVDIYIKLHAAFYNDIQVMVTHPLETARHYIKTNFLMDIIASFPIELLAIPFITDVRMRFSDTPRSISIIRFS